MAALRRVQVPLDLDVNFEHGMITITSDNSINNNVDFAPVYTGGGIPSIEFKQTADGVSKLTGGIQKRILVDIGYPESEAPAMTLPNIKQFVTDLKHRRAVIFHIIGAGGTGGYVIRDLFRYLQSLKSKGDMRQFYVNIVDGDVVEEKNLIRQNFIHSDIGKKKGAVLANRYGAAFGIPVKYHDMFLSEHMELTRLSNESINALDMRDNEVAEIIIGCVDNHAARRVIHNYLTGRVRRTAFWIDSGNERLSGQVVCGSKGRWRENHIGMTEAHWKDLYALTELPTVTTYYPEILDAAQDLEGSDNTSCADRALVEDQNIFINMSAAIHVLNFTRQLVGSESMSNNKVEFDIKGLSTVGLLTPENLAKLTKG